MIPLVTRLDEVDRTREMVAEEAERLKQLGVEAASTVPIGVMVETPAAAVMADRLAEVSDFLSVGATTSRSTRWWWIAATPGSPTASRRTIPPCCAC